MGRYYDLKSKDLSLFDDFEPNLKAATSSDEYGKLWNTVVPTIKSVQHKITEGPTVLVVSDDYVHTTMEFVFEFIPKKGQASYFKSRSSLLWHCTSDGWKIVREHNSAKQVENSLYKNAH